MEPSRTRTRSI